MTLRARLAEATQARDEFEAAYVAFHEKAEALTLELALVRDTLAKRTDAHQRVIDTNTALRATVAACPSCSTKESPSDSTP